jgi:hypothetical protein
VFGAIPVQKKFGKPFSSQPIPETPRRTPADLQNRARQQGRIPVAIEEGRKPLALIPVENASPKPLPRKPISQQIPFEEFPKIKPQPQQPRPQAPLIPLIEEESFEELDEPEEEEVIVEQPKAPQQPPQQQRRPVEGVFAIPQQQLPTESAAPAPARQAAQNNYPRRFETFTPSPSEVTRQRSGILI